MTLRAIPRLSCVVGLVGLLGTAVAAEPVRELEAVRAHVSSRLDVPLDDVEVVHLGIVDGLACDESAQFHVSSSPGEDFRGSAELRITGLEGDAACGNVRVRARLVIWRTVPVAASSAPVGERLQLVEKRVPHDEVGGVPVALGTGPWEARVPLREGQPVTQNLVRAVPDAASGDMVTIEAGGGALRVVASGRLLENASVGDTVRVSNLATKQVVRGVLVDPKRVRAGGEG